MKAYDFERQEEPPATVNPSLWRQARLNAIHGLFKVTDRVYQARYDLSYMTIIEGDTGLILIDPMLTAETSKASLDLYYQNRPQKPVAAVIYTHSHADHYGGVKEVIKEEDVNAGKIKIFAPDHFMDFAVSENVIAGNAMSSPGLVYVWRGASAWPSRPSRRRPRKSGLKWHVHTYSSNGPDHRRHP